MYSLHLTPEQIEIRDTVREFVAQEIKPVALKASRLEAAERRFPDALLARVSRIGLRTLALSESLGGAGADNLMSCVVAEELAAGDVDLAYTFTTTSILARELFDRSMDAEQRSRFLPEFLEHDSYHLAYAEREAGAECTLGSHYHRATAPAPAIRTTAQRTGRKWVVNGAKTLVANAPLAKLFAVLVNTDSGLATLLVPADTKGVRVEEPNGNRGWYHGLCADVCFSDCAVPEANLLAGVPSSVAHGEPRGVPLKQAMNIGVGRAAYEAALEYARLRVQGSRRIVEHQAVGTLLADCAIRLQIARSAVWQAAWASDHPDVIADRSIDDVPLTQIADVYTSEAMHRVALEAADVFGAMGVMRDMPLTKYVRDALIFLHTGSGTSDTRLKIAEAIAGFERA